MTTGSAGFFVVTRHFDRSDAAAIPVRCGPASLRQVPASHRHLRHPRRLRDPLAQRARCSGLQVSTIVFWITCEYVSAVVVVCSVLVKRSFDSPCLRKDSSIETLADLRKLLPPRLYVVAIGNVKEH